MIVDNGNQKDSDGRNEQRRLYIAPQLTRFGAVRNLTQGGLTGVAESGTQPSCGGGPKSPCPLPSDRNLKEHVVCIGKHPLGIGLYLFDYKSQFRRLYGSGRQFGVMADEVQVIMPDAVSINPDGYKMVNYALLGINRRVQ